MEQREYITKILTGITTICRNDVNTYMWAEKFRGVFKMPFY